MYLGLFTDTTSATEGQSAQYAFPFDPSGFYDDWTVTWQTVDGSATVGDGDYVFTSGTGISGEVPVLLDGVLDPDEEFLVQAQFTGTYVNEFNIIVTDTADFELTVTVGEPLAGNVWISDAIEWEGNGFPVMVMSFTVWRSGGTAAFDIDFATSDGSALAGGDYITNTGTLHFAEGVNSQVVNVTLVGDTVFEADETLHVTLSNPVGNVSVTDGQASGQITNDDPTGVPSEGDDDIILFEPTTGYHLFAGNDTLTGSYGADGVFGDAGHDYISGLGGNDTLDGGLGSDTLLGGQGNDSLDGADGNDRLIGDNGNDTVNGGAGSDWMYGGGNNDRLYGDAGNDHLFGQSNSDVLFGGYGNDTVTGGAGVDYFVFDTALNATWNIDTIADYTVADDTIQLDNAIFTAFGTYTGPVWVAAFYTGTAAHDASDRIIYDNTTGAVFYDPDGTGAQAQVQFATLTPGLSLTSSEFRIV